MGYKSIPLLIALLGMSLSFGAWAQSQTGGQSIPYDMDEECYRLQEAMARGDKVLAAHEELKSVARETQLSQYFYYSYSLTKNYFYNNRMQLKAMELVREIAGRMGGRVFLDTSYTEGARFVFVLPLTPPVADND